MPQPTILGGFRIGEETGESEIDEGAFSYAMFIPFYVSFFLYRSRRKTARLECVQIFQNLYTAAQDK